MLERLFEVDIDGAGAAIEGLSCMKGKGLRMTCKPSSHLEFDNAHVFMGAVASAFAMNNEASAVVLANGFMEKVHQFEPGVAFAKAVEIEHGGGP